MTTKEQTLKSTDGSNIRWEYAEDNEHERHPFFHMQMGPNQMPFGASTLDLNRVHFATGRVLIEHVLHFVIGELEAEGCCDDWLQHLNQSEKKFKNRYGLPLHVSVNAP
ncbi:MAG: hypothetical protein AAF355_02010 [Myxococcota bacterium]